MPYVQRNEAGEIIALYNLPQEGFAEEYVEDATLPAPSLPALTYKTDIWRRCTEAEAEMLDAALAEAPVQLRRLWDDATQIDHDAPEFVALRSQMVSQFGEGRADEILAPSEV